MRLLLVLMVALLSACASTPHKVQWGQEAHITTTYEKFKQASVRAFKDPGTWVPLASAAVILASGNDDKWTQIALANNPTYGSKTEAARQSDDASILLDKLWMGSTLITDSGSVSNKLKGMFAQGVIINISNTTTNVIKELVEKREPDPNLHYVEGDGFPSNHSTPPFTRAALIRRNMQYTDVNDFTKYTIVAGSYYLATVSAYGRVEAGLHSYADQLAGAALGNFIGLVLFDTFFERIPNWSAAVTPVDEALVASFQYRF